MLVVLTPAKMKQHLSAMTCGKDEPENRVILSQLLTLLSCLNSQEMREVHLKEEALYWHVELLVRAPPTRQEDGKVSKSPEGKVTLIYDRYCT